MCPHRWQICLSPGMGVGVMDLLRGECELDCGLLGSSAPHIDIDDAGGLGHFRRLLSRARCGAGCGAIQLAGPDKLLLQVAAHFEQASLAADNPALHGGGCPVTDNAALVRVQQDLAVCVLIAERDFCLVFRTPEIDGQNGLHVPATRATEQISVELHFAPLCGVYVATATYVDRKSVVEG